MAADLGKRRKPGDKQLSISSTSLNSLDLGEAVKENTRLREELLRAQTKARARESAAGSCHVGKLDDALKKELEEVPARCMSLVNQNATLHQQLESVSAQAVRIVQAAKALQTEMPAGESTVADGDDASELRSVIAYLGCVAEIAELQLDMLIF